MPNSNNPIVAQPNRLWSNPYAPPSEFEKGLAGFADEMQALGGGVAGMAGQAGMEVLPQIAQPYAKDLRDWGLDTYRENIAESQAGWQAPKVARIEDIKLGEEGGVGRLGDWATYHGTKGLATLAGLALSGGAGGAAAKIATKRVVKDMAKRQASKLAKRPVKEELEKGFQREAKAALQRRGQAISKEAVEGIGEGALAQVQRNVTRGAIAGGTAGAFGLEGGGAFGQQVEGGVAPEDALLPSAGVGLVNAALEMVAPVQVAKKLGLGQWASRGLAKHIKTDKTLAKKAQRIAGKMLKGATTTAAQEGITEGIQELVQIAGERIAKDEELLAELDPEQRSQIMNAAAAGGLTGGLFGGATGPFMQGPMDARSQVVRALPPEVQQLVTNETTVSDPVEGETQEQYVARVAREVVGETAEKAAQKAAETQAAPKEGVPSTKVGAPGPESEGVPSAGDVEGPLPVALTYAEWLEQTKQRDAASVTPEETGTLYAEYQAYKEGVQNAQAVREDEGGLPPTGQVGEGVQDERREGREFVAEEGGQAAGQVSPEEKLAGDVVVGDIVTPANSEDANIVPAGKVVKVSKDGMVQVEGNKAWFPKGLFNTDRGDTLESRGEPVAKTVQQVEDDTIKELGEGWLNRAKKTGLLEIRDEAGPDGLSAEFSPTTGKITVYAKSLTEGSSVAQVLHETSHATMEMLTQGREMEFAQEIAQRKGDLEQRAGHMAELSRIGWLARELEIKHNLWNTQGKEFETEYARVEEEIAAGKKKLTKEEAAKLERDAAQVGATETVAYYAQYAHDKGVGGGLFRRIINAIKAGWMLSDVGRALGKVGLKPKISDGMAVELARRSSRYAVELREEMDRLVGEGKPEATVGAPTVVEEGEPALESRVWHSGPHQWQPEPGFPYGRPRLDKVQSGEGGQLFGWGFYSAENEAVSGPGSVYAKSFAGKAAREQGAKLEDSLGNEVDGFELAVKIRRDAGLIRGIRGGPSEALEILLGSGQGDFELTKAEVKRRSNIRRAAHDEARVKEIRQHDAEGRDWVLRNIDSQITEETKAEQAALLLLNELESTGHKAIVPGASTFHLNIPDADIARMIQWEKPLSKQTEEVQEALKKIDWDAPYRLSELTKMWEEYIEGHGLLSMNERDFLRAVISRWESSFALPRHLQLNTKEAFEAELAERGEHWKPLINDLRVANAFDGIRSQLKDKVNRASGPLPKEAMGQDIYRRLGDKLPHIPGEHPKKKVSEYLESIGIVGNKYLDWGSRAAQQVREEARLVDSQGYPRVLIEESENEQRSFDLLIQTKGDFIEAIKAAQQQETREGRITAGILQEWQSDGLTLDIPKTTFNYVIWNQDVLDRVAHLNPQTGEPLLGQIDRALHSKQPALDRMAGALDAARQVETKLGSMPETFSSAWITNPLSTAPEEVNNPGFLNRLKTNYVEKFNDLWQMSKESATKFNLARSKRAAFQKDFEDEFIKPWIDIAGKLMKEMSGQDGEFTLEDANDSFAAWHIVNDNVNELLAMKNSNEEAIRLEKTLQEYEGTLEENDPRRAEVRAVRRALQKGRRNLLSGKTWEGDTPMSADGTTTRTLTGMEVQSKLKREVDTAYDAAVGDTKIWKLSEIQDLRMDWEMLKHHGAGFATPETMSSDPEVQQRVNELLDATGRPKDAREVLARVQDNDTFQGLTQRAKDVAHMTREQLVRGGLITREEANAMANQYKHWVPLRRSAFNMQHAVDAYFGRGELGKGAKIRTGTSEVNEPVHTMQNLMASYDAAVTSAEANIARDFLAQQIEANPQHWDGWFKVKKDPDVKKSYVKYGFVHTRQSGAGEEDIPFFRDGERYYIEVDDANQRAKTLSVAIRNLDSQELGPVFNVMNKVNSWIRWVNISASPAFLLMNAPRDYFTARLNLKATEIADYGKDVRKEMRSSLRDLRKHFMQGERVDEILDWERAGGRISFVQSLRPNDESWGSIEAKIRHRQGDFNFGPGMEANFGPGVGEAVGRGRDLLEKMETINIIAENVMRYSVWKVAKNRGLSDDKAAMLSKDVTTNFDRRGLRAQTLGVYWLFYNATVQGNTQVLRNVFYGPNKKKLWAALGSVMATAFLNDQIGALTSDDEDKDGRSDWDSRPEWKRDKFASIAGSNLLWPGDESTYATVPLPWVFNTIWRFGEMASEVVRGKKDPLDVPADMAGLMIGTFNPIGGGDASLAQMAAPTAADPLVQIWENTSAFGRPLGPTRFPGQDFLPDAEMSWLNTPKGYKWLAREVNQITGGSPAEQGLVDWRPSTYKVLADTLMGGGGRFMAQLGRSAMSPLMGELPKLKDAPGLRTFFFAPGDPIEAQLYHERMAKVEQAKKAEKTFRQGPLRDLMELQRVRSEYAGELRMVSMSKDIERQIKDLRSQLRAAQVRNQESRGETLKNRIEKAQERFNKSWARRVGN